VPPHADGPVHDEELLVARRLGQKVVERLLHQYRPMDLGKIVPVRGHPRISS
jgi:hypothetical protein